MFHLRHSQFAVSLVLVAVVVGCGKGKEEGKSGSSSKAPATASPSGKGACALLTQKEVDGWFESSVGAGQSESLGEGAELCSWPNGKEPKLLLQVGPAAPSATAAVDLGEGYRVSEIAGMSGPAAAALQTVKSPAGDQVVITLLAMNVSGKTVTISPIGHAVGEGTNRFERLKALVEAVAKRL